MALRAEIGDIVTGTDETGRHRIGRVAAAIELPGDQEPRTVTVATPEGDWRVQPDALSVVRPNFVQETWAALRYPGHNPWQPDPHQN